MLVTFCALSAVSSLRKGGIGGGPVMGPLLSLGISAKRASSPPAYLQNSSYVQPCRNSSNREKDGKNIQFLPWIQRGRGREKYLNDLNVKMQRGMCTFVSHSLSLNHIRFQRSNRDRQSWSSTKRTFISEWDLANPC